MQILYGVCPPPADRSRGIARAYPRPIRSKRSMNPGSSRRPSSAGCLLRQPEPVRNPLPDDRQYRYRGPAIEIEATSRALAKIRLYGSFFLWVFLL